jgi:hypothetical protein
MAYQTILRTKPDSFYVIDSAPHEDLSRSRLANLTLTNSIHPLGAFNYGKLAISPPTFTVPTPVDSNSWSVAIVVKPIEPGKIFEFTSSSGTGLKYQDGKLTFSLRHSDNSETSVSKSYTFKTVADVICVKSEDSIALYVAGVLMGSTAIESPFDVVTAQSITVGDASAKIYSGNIAFWNRSVSADESARFAIAYRRYPFRREISNIKGTAMFTPELFSVSGSLVPNRVVLNDGVIESSPGTYESDIDDTGISVSSQVTFGYLTQNESMGVRFAWSESLSATVESSLDAGENWSPVLNGRVIPGTRLPVEEIPLAIRVTFAAGSIERPFISGVTIIDYTTDVANPLTSTNRIATISGDVYVPITAHHPQLHGDGMRFYGSGILEFAPDISDSVVNTAGLELAFTPEASDLTGTKYIMNSAPEHSSNISVIAGKLNFTGFSSVYVNGVATATNSLTLQPGLTYLINANYTTSHNQKITFGNEGNSVSGAISTIALRAQSVSANEALDTFNLYMKHPVYRSQSDSGLTISDNEVSLYRKDWTTRGS